MRRLRWARYWYIARKYGRRGHMWWWMPARVWDEVRADLRGYDWWER